MDTTLEKKRHIDFFEKSDEEIKPWRKKAETLLLDIQIANKSVKIFEKLNSYAKPSKYMSHVAEFILASKKLLWKLEAFKAFHVYVAEVSKTSPVALCLSMFEQLKICAQSEYKEWETRKFMTLHWHAKKALEKWNRQSKGMQFLPFLTRGTVLITNSQTDIIQVVSHVGQYSFDEADVIFIGDQSCKLTDIKEITHYSQGKVEYVPINIPKYLDAYHSGTYDVVEKLTKSAFSLSQDLMNRIDYEKVFESIRHFYFYNNWKMTKAMRRHIRRNQNRFILSHEELQKRREEAEEIRNIANSRNGS